jgi:predicted dehydrogenase
MNRRQFIKRSSSASLAMAVAGGLGPGLASAAPSDRVRVGVMGVNGRGRPLARGFALLPGSEVAYICDVDAQAMARAVEAVREAQNVTPQAVTDFRRMLDDPTLDALVIAAPEHWQAPAAILACAAGKHVYVEKPASHNPHEGELLVAAARKHNRVVQMGNQRRSWHGNVEGVRLAREGAIGRVFYARSWYANDRPSIGVGRESAPPPHLNWDLWQGPAPRRPYRDNVVHYNWHWFWHWGTGEAGNNGVHALDLVRWGLDVDYPTRVTSKGGRFRYADDWETPDTQVLTFDFEGGKSAVWEGLSVSRHGINGTSFGVTFHGENGSILIEGTGYTLFDADNQKVQTYTEQVQREGIPLAGPGFQLDAPHFLDFLSSIREGRRPVSDIEDGQKSTLLCHLGNIAHRTGRMVRCDPATGRILGDSDAMRFWRREYHQGWTPRV